MPYLTMRQKSKATTKPWFSRLLQHPARKRSGSILGHNTRTHIYSLTYFPRTYTGMWTEEIQPVSAVHAYWHGQNVMLLSGRRALENRDIPALEISKTYLP